LWDGLPIFISSPFEGRITSFHLLPLEGRVITSHLLPLEGGG